MQRSRLERPTSSRGLLPVVRRIIGNPDAVGSVVRAQELQPVVGKLQDNLDAAVIASLAQVVRWLARGAGILERVRECPGAYLFQQVRSALVQLGLQLSIVALRRSQIRFQRAVLLRQREGCSELHRQYIEAARAMGKLAERLERLAGPHLTRAA